MVKSVLYLTAWSMMTAACAGCHSSGGWPWQKTGTPVTTYGVAGPPPATVTTPMVSPPTYGPVATPPAASMAPALSSPQLTAPNSAR